VGVAPYREPGAVPPAPLVKPKPASRPEEEDELRTPWVDDASAPLWGASGPVVFAILMGIVAAMFFVLFAITLRPAP
jgi:hypothetical protein